jgi:hypothetical protein
MDVFVRKCENCQTVDRRESWDSVAAASEAGIFDAPWACSSCAWSEFDLIEASEELARTT